MDNEKISQPLLQKEKASDSILEHKKGWMSANAVAKYLETGLGDAIVWNQSLVEGVPSTKKKVHAIVSVHAIRFLAQKYLQNDPTLAEIQKNKTQVKEQYAPLLVRDLVKDIRSLQGANGFIPEYRVAKMLGITQSQLQNEMKYWAYKEGQVKAAKEFNRVFLCVDPQFLEDVTKK